MSEKTWGIAPTGFVEVTHVDIALVRLNEGIMPALDDYSQESIVIEDL